MAESLLDSEFETMEEWDIAKRWSQILYSLVFGKKMQGTQHFPVVLQKDKDESFN